MAENGDTENQQPSERPPKHKGKVGWSNDRISLVYWLTLVSIALPPCILPGLAASFACTLHAAAQQPLSGIRLLACCMRLLTGGMGSSTAAQEGQTVGSRGYRSLEGRHLHQR